MHEEERTIGSDSSGQNSIWKGWMWVSLLAKSITLSSTWIISGLGKTSLSSNIWTDGAPWVHQAIAHCRHVLGGLHKDLLGKLKNYGLRRKTCPKLGCVHFCIWLMKVPAAPSSLYIRPSLLGTEGTLGLGPSSQVFLEILLKVGPTPLHRDSF